MTHRCVTELINWIPFFSGNNHPLGPLCQYVLILNQAWISNYILKMLTKITYPFSNFKSEATLKNLGNCIIPIQKKYNVTKTVMMTSSNGNIFRVTGPSCGEFTDHRWIPPHKGQWGGALMFSLIWAWINDWVNNREAGDLRHHRAHYDVIVMNNDKLYWW